MDIQIEKILSSLHSRHIHGIFAENSDDACRKIMSLIPDDAIVGIGDSTTMRQIGIPKALKFEVTTTYERDWSRLKNGELLDAAERHGFEVLVTTDSNLKYQQDLKSRRIAIVVLSTPSWPRIQRAVAEVVGAVDAASEGSYTEVEIS